MQSLKKIKIHINYKLLSLFVIGFVLLLFRGMFLFKNPTIYSEDGSWYSSLISNGFFDTLINSRADYFVLGNLLLLQIANFLNFVLFEYDLSNLPVIINVVQLIFYAFVAIVPVIIFKKYINIKYLVLLWAMIILCPFGNSGFEIFGRLSNVGFIFPFLSFCLLTWRVCNIKKECLLKTISCDIVLFICAATNPICFLFSGIGFLIITFILLYNERSIKKILKYKAYILFVILMFILFVLGIIILARMGGVVNPYKTVFIKGEVIEFFFRSIAYPFIFPFYNHMNNKIAMLFFLFLLALIGTAFIKAESKKQKSLLAASLFAAIVSTVVMLITRYGLTTVLFSYYTPVMDRYFYGQNLMMLIPFVLALSILVNHKNILKYVFSIIPVVYLFFIYIMNWNLLFEFSEPKFMHIDNTFTQNVVKAYSMSESTEDDILYLVEIEPKGWSMTIPSKYVKATIKNQKIYAKNITDDNFENGIARNNTMILFENNNQNKLILEGATEFYSLNNSLIIDRIEINQEWIYVYFHQRWNTDIKMFDFNHGIEVIR